MLGKIFVYIGLIASITAIVSYFLSVRKGEKFAIIGRTAYYILTASIVVASIYLLANILQHNFQLSYIWEYSSKELHDWFLIASFYSGQQGSFLLWGLMLAIIGVFLIPSSKKFGYESTAMGFYSVILLFVVLMLIFKSPFNYVWETFADSGIEKGFTPPNGRGLNPVLQNYWITIHPPILFLGYSAMSVPYILALTGLFKKEYHRWLNIAIPWTLFSVAMLGLGIMLGGFWAYETLGWGGFWGWDPVENSSLLPWLAGVALVHTMVVQRKTKGLVKTNFLLAMLSFVLVLYATYLTRSGILGDTSVHSFVEPGKIVYFLLLVFMVFFIALAVTFLLVRFKNLQEFIGKTQFKVSSKEFTLSIGSILLLASTVIIFIGTSWPWIAPLFGKEKAAIDIQLYNEWNLPIAFLILVLNAVSLYQRWYSKTFKEFFKMIAFPTIVSVVATIVFVLMGYDKVDYALLFFAAVFSLLSNLEFLIKNIVKTPKLTGAYLSHLGISLLIFGVITSGGYDYSKDIQFVKGQTKEVFGYKLTFNDIEQIEKDLQDRQKYKYNIAIKHGNGKSVVSPILYWSSFNQWSTPYLEPGIKSKITKDIYISPKAVETVYNGPQAKLLKGNTIDVPVNQSISMTLEGFDMSEGMTTDGRVKLGAIINFTGNDFSYRDTVMTLLDSESWVGQPIWAQIKGTNIELGLEKLIKGTENIQNTRAMFLFNKTGNPRPEEQQILTAEITIKPFINLVWLGTIGIVLGFFIAIFKYRKKYITE